MEQFNSDTYKKETLFEEFYHSCLGKIIILAVVAVALFIIALFLQPDKEMVRMEAKANIHQCLQDNYESKDDELDEFFHNVSRTFTLTDTTLTNKDVYEAFKRYNTLEVYSHSGYTTAYLHNAFNPGGTRIAIGIFGMVISTISYNDMVLDLGPARGKYNEKLIEPSLNDMEMGENPALNPYHYKGNPED